MDFSDYKPNPDVLSGLTDVDFVAFIGPTAAGKTTLLDALITQSWPMMKVVHWRATYSKD